jgi:hypothetical protein
LGRAETQGLKIDSESLKTIEPGEPEESGEAVGSWKTGLFLYQEYTSIDGYLNS